MLSEDISGVLLQCQPSDSPALQLPPAHYDSFATTVGGNLQSCHFNTCGFSMSSSLHYDPSALEYLSPPPPPLPPLSSCPSSNSSTASDDAEEQQQQQQQLQAIDERKRRRMVSNRESARRSRMRKQRQLDELRSHVIRLRTEKNYLEDRLNQFMGSHDRILQENARLKEEASNLKQMLGDKRINDPADNNTDPISATVRDSKVAVLDNIVTGNY